MLNANALISFQKNHDQKSQTKNNLYDEERSAMEFLNTFAVIT